LDFSRDVAIATNYSQKIGVFPGQIYFVALPFGNGLQYHNSHFKRFNRINFSILSTILLAFGPETSKEFMLLTIASFPAIRQKSAYHTNYLTISWTYLTSFTGLVGVLVRMILQIFVWQPVKYGRFANVAGTTFTLCFGIRQRIGRS